MVIVIVLLTLAFSLLGLAGVALGYVIGTSFGAPEDLELGVWRERLRQARAERREYEDAWMGERW